MYKQIYKQTYKKSYKQPYKQTYKQLEFDRKAEQTSDQCYSTLASVHLAVNRYLENKQIVVSKIMEERLQTILDVPQKELYEPQSHSLSRTKPLFGAVFTDHTKDKIQIPVNMLTSSSFIVLPRLSLYLLMNRFRSRFVNMLIKEISHMYKVFLRKQCPNYILIFHCLKKQIWAIILYSTLK